MRFMIVVKADESSEAGMLPSQEVFVEMGKYNEELVKAGVLLAADGLHPSSKGVRVRLADGKYSVTAGPFPDVADLVAGYWWIDVASKEEAIEWVKRCPIENATLEIRPGEYHEFPAPGAEKARRFLSIYTPDHSRPPNPEHMGRVEKLMGEAIKAGELAATGAIQPVTKGARVRFTGAKRTVTDGPFTEAKEVVAGWAMLRGDTIEDAIAQAKRFLQAGGDGVCELRPVFLADA